MIVDFDSVPGFPPLPDVEALAKMVLMPLTSGIETLAIAVVGHLVDGTPFARRVLSNPLACLPNDLGAAAFSFGGIVASDFLRWTDSQPASNWNLPLIGLRLGPEFSVDGYDLESVIANALSQCALFPQREKEAHEQLVVIPRGHDEVRFMQSVRQYVLKSRPVLENSFGRKFTLSGRGEGDEIDFVGNHYATCFAAINPKSRSKVRVTRASAALWRLARARDAFGFAAPQLIELTAWIPPEGLPIYSSSEYESVHEVVEELAEQARREDLRVFAASDAILAGARLLEVETTQRFS
ncbi:MAG TPA: hypothetical protein VLC92_21480 [Rhodocyclaceae bacterium]|nr:hypothetical protein [Rhodocyclaceae bacterium]